MTSEDYKRVGAATVSSVSTQSMSGYHVPDPSEVNKNEALPANGEYRMIGAQSSLAGTMTTQDSSVGQYVVPNQPELRTEASGVYDNLQLTQEFSAPPQLPNANYNAPPETNTDKYI